MKYANKEYWDCQDKIKEAIEAERTRIEKIVEKQENPFRSSIDREYSVGYDYAKADILEEIRK